MSTERAAAPPRWYAAAMRAGSKSAHSTPLLGEAFLISAMMAGARAPRAARKSRRAARRGFGLALPLVQAGDARGELFAFSGDNTGQDVWNSVGQG